MGKYEAKKRRQEIEDQKEVAKIEVLYALATCHLSKLIWGDAIAYVSTGQAQMSIGSQSPEYFYML